MKKMVLALLTAGFSASTFAVSVPSVLSDNMVLQRDAKVPIWGSGKPGEKISVEFDGQQKSAVADKNGSWRVNLDRLKESRSGKTMKIKGDNTIEIKDILVGDVWLCSGQSNMGYTLKNIIGGKEIAAKSANSALRLFQVSRVWNRTPQNDVKAKWKVSDPSSSAGFSAVGFLVGQALEKQTNVPIGLLDISWGGCRIEAMTPKESFTEAGVKQEEIAAFHKTIDELDKKADNDLRKDKQRLPTVLFNAMVHPVTPFAVKGLVWYQGEDNHYEGARYTEKLKAFIHGWRKYFENQNLPMYVVMIPPWQYNKENPTQLPEFWRAQQVFAETDPHAGYIVTTDCGDPKDIHPKNKVPLAARMAALILYKEYKQGDDSVMSPTMAGCSVKNGEVTVTFNHPNGLKTRDGKSVSHLELAGSDGKFFPASGEVKDEKLMVKSPEVKDPAYVRFGWDKLANPNLVNKRDIPVYPFSVKVK